jgi:hypothetical protein
MFSHLCTFEFVQMGIFFYNEIYMKRILLLGWITCCAQFLSAQLRTTTTGKIQALFETIRSGSAGELDKLLSGPITANDSLDDYSALMAASLNGTVDQMKILILHGANVNYKTKMDLQLCGLQFPTPGK